MILNSKNKQLNDKIQDDTLLYKFPNYSTLILRDKTLNKADDEKAGEPTRIKPSHTIKPNFRFKNKRKNLLG